MSSTSQHEPEVSNYAETNASIALKRVFPSLPRTSQERIDAAQNEHAFDVNALTSSELSAAHEKGKTALYLAYGSNLCNETFRGVRGIKPISQVNVLVPSLRLTFDLPGLPYTEPCFANTAQRVPDAPYTALGDLNGTDYHKNRWHKGLVGVVYEVTLRDYAHIIATEGGGASYKDILVDCYILPTSPTVPLKPNTLPFKAHTLFAPILDENNAVTVDRVIRPDPAYAQPSARYLKLITDGAAECDLPAEYQDYLNDIRPYTITSKRQAVGKALFTTIWMPLIMFIFALNRRFQDKKGRSPAWLSKILALVFAAVWVSYDGVFKKAFGDGERTIGDEAMGRRFRQEWGYRNGEEKEARIEEAVGLLDGSARKHMRIDKI